MSIVTKSGLVAVVLAACVIGCGGGARKHSERAVASVEDTRGLLEKGTPNIDRILTTLNELEARPADLRPVYKKLVSQIDGLEGRAREAEARIRDMRVRSKEYSQKWEADYQSITNPELRAAATLRAEDVRDRFARIDQRAQEVRAAYAPLIDDLGDLETFLTNDLTYSGVAAAKPVFDSVRAKAAVAKEKVALLQTEITDTYMRLSPKAAPAK